MPIRFLVIVAALSFSVASSIVVAQGRPEKGPALTEPPADDPNYVLMGEYLGTITGADGETRTLGLQIRVAGGNEFDALTFFGGLPGQPEFQSEPIRMIGRRYQDFVVLSGGPWAIFVRADSCSLVDHEGKKIGTLDRIQRSSPTLHARPPKQATVLFDGTNIDQFTKASMTDDGLLEQGADIKPMFQDFNLHLEFRLPYMPIADGQARGNSGIYLQSRYECQILDSFALDPLFNGCGAIYRFKKPDVNACLPPLVWQTYDIQFTAPRWAADGTKIRNAHITSWLNGIKVQDDVDVPNKTGHGKEEGPTLLPTRLQDHGDPVRFRNIWVVDRGLDGGDFPVLATPEDIEAAARAEQARLAAANEPAPEESTSDAEPADTADSDSEESADADSSATSEGEPSGDGAQGNKTTGSEPASEDV